MKIEYYEEMLEQEAINKYLNMIANDYNGELAKTFQEKYINKDKEISILKDDKEHLGEFLKESTEEIERLHTIIKEVKEYCLTKAKGRLERTLYDDILEILNKESEYNE